MSNRQIALLVLIGAFAAIAGISYFFLVRNVSSLVLTVGGPESATVSLKKGEATIIAAECERTCAIPEIPPFDYELVVSSTGFLSQSQRLSIRSRDQISLKFDLVRDVRTEGFRSDRKEAIGEIRAKRAILAESGAEEARREFVGQYRGNDYYVDRIPEYRLVERKGGWLEDANAGGSGGTASESAEPADDVGKYSETVLFRTAGGIRTNHLL